MPITPVNGSCNGCCGGCGCLLVAGDNTTVTGVGSPLDPYVISAADGIALGALVSMGLLADLPLIFPFDNNSMLVSGWRYVAGLGTVPLPTIQPVDPTFTEMTYAEMRLSSADGTTALILEADAPVDVTTQNPWAVFSTYGARGVGLTIATDGGGAATGMTVTVGGLWYVEFQCVRNP